MSELVSLRWSQVLDYGKGSGIIRVIGKGDKERNVLLSGSIWNELLAWRKGKPDDSWVFPAVHGYGHLHRSIVNRVIRRLAKEAGIKGNVSRDILNDRACRLEINFRDRDRH